MAVRGRGGRAARDAEGRPDRSSDRRRARVRRDLLVSRSVYPEDRIRRLVPESEGDLVSVLAGLGQGDGLILGEAVPLPTRVQFDGPFPTPNSDDVDFYGKWIDGPEDLDVDEIVKRWRRQER